MSGRVTIALPANGEEAIRLTADTVLICGNQPDVILEALRADVPCVVVCQAAVPEEAAVWSRVELRTRGCQSLALYDAAGTLLEEITVNDSGSGYTGLLTQGTYFVVCKEGLLQFSLDEKGTLSLLCGEATVEGHCLSYGERSLTTLYITGKALGEWEDFLLVGPDYRYRQVLRCEAGQALSCQFTGLLPGEYSLERNGTFVCRFTVEAGQVRQCVRLSAT